jgi:hypothetical protein
MLVKNGKAHHSILLKLHMNIFGANFSQIPYPTHTTFVDKASKD